MGNLVYLKYKNKWRYSTTDLIEMEFYSLLFALFLVEYFLSQASTRTPPAPLVWPRSAVLPVPLTSSSFFVLFFKYKVSNCPGCLPGFVFYGIN
jgi:hypothetical protein